MKKKRKVRKKIDRSQSINMNYRRKQKIKEIKYILKGSKKFFAFNIY